jgi:hypothetical protein
MGKSMGLRGVGAREGMVGAPGASDRSYSPMDKSTGAFQAWWRADVATDHIHPWSESMGAFQVWDRANVARKLIHLWTSRSGLSVVVAGGCRRRANSAMGKSMGVFRAW